jgi:hypothetical protein
MPKERTYQENVIILRNMKRLLEAWLSGDTDEEKKAAMRPVLREIRREFLDRQASERVQDYYSSEKSN